MPLPTVNNYLYQGYTTKKEGQSVKPCIKARNKHANQQDRLVSDPVGIIGRSFMLSRDVTHNSCQCAAIIQAPHRGARIPDVIFILTYFHPQNHCTSFS